MEKEPRRKSNMGKTINTQQACGRPSKIKVAENLRELKTMWNIEKEKSQSKRE